MRPVRLALIGFGKWGRNYVKAAEDSGEAVVSEIVNTAWRYRSRRTAISATSDAVVYAGHPSLAALACEGVLANNKPIIVEKPAGLSIADAERIAAAEAKSKAFVLVGHQHLFAHGVEHIKRGDDAPPMRMYWDGPEAHDFPAHWDYLPHPISISLAVRGIAPIRVKWHIDGELRIARLEYVGLRDIVSHRRASSKWICVRTDDHDNRHLYDGYMPQEPPLTRQVRAFARAVRNGGTDDYRFGAKWAVDVARILTAAEQA